jgi:hypothetical protein
VVALAWVTLLATHDHQHHGQATPAVGPTPGLLQDAGGLLAPLPGWALMAVTAVVGHSSHAGLVWMTALTALAMLEELTLLGRHLLRPSAIALALAAGLALIGV